MKIYIKDRFGVIPNHILTDPRVSLRAKGLWVYIQSKPDDWDFASERISRENLDGRDAVRSGLKELEKFGFLRRDFKRSDGGHWDCDYILSDIENTGNLTLPFSEDLTGTDNPTPGNPTPGNPTTENQATNKEGDTKKELQNNTETGRELTPKEESIAFFNAPLDEIMAAFNYEAEMADKIRLEIESFRQFWTEKNATGTKERWQMEPTFEIKRRLNTWFRRVRDFQGRSLQYKKAERVGKTLKTFS